LRVVGSRSATVTNRRAPTGGALSGEANNRAVRGSCDDPAERAGASEDRWLGDDGNDLLLAARHGRPAAKATIASAAAPVMTCSTKLVSAATIACSCLTRTWR